MSICSIRCSTRHVRPIVRARIRTRQGILGNRSLSAILRIYPVLCASSALNESSSHSTDLSPIIFVLWQPDGYQRDLWSTLYSLAVDSFPAICPYLVTVCINQEYAYCTIDDHVADGDSTTLNDFNLQLLTTTQLEHTRQPILGHLDLQVPPYVFDGALLFNILVGKCHVHIHHNSLIRSLARFENPECEVLLAMRSQGQYRESLAVARAADADYTQGYCYQDRASSKILFPVGLGTTTVQDKMTQGKAVLRNPAEARLDTGKVAQGPRNSSPGASKVIVPARLRSRPVKESHIRTRAHNESLGSRVDSKYAPVALAVRPEPVRWHMTRMAGMRPWVW